MISDGFPGVLSRFTNRMISGLLAGKLTVARWSLRAWADICPFNTGELAKQAKWKQCSLCSLTWLKLGVAVQHNACEALFELIAACQQVGLVFGSDQNPFDGLVLGATEAF